MNEDELLKKRFAELDMRAYMKGFCTFSEFLNLDEISTLKSTKLSGAPMLFGGHRGADRCVAGFGENVQESDFPIKCIEIAPLQQKFADSLNHRDFLGSLMNLGINRNTLGDIIIKDNVGYLFCLDTISQYIVENLTRIKHTSVSCRVIDGAPDFINSEPESEELLTSSLRVDTVVASLYKLSRNAVAELFTKEKVYINSKIATKESVNLKENDVVSVRGYGKFIFCSPLRQTKKGRCVVEVKVYK